METATEVQEIRVHKISLSQAEAERIIVDPREFVKALRQLLGATPAKNGRVQANGHRPKRQRRARRTAKNAWGARGRTGVRCPGCKELFDNNRKFGQHKRTCAKWQLQQVEAEVRNGKE